MLSIVCVAEDTSGLREEGGHVCRVKVNAMTRRSEKEREKKEDKGIMT